MAIPGSHRAFDYLPIYDPKGQAWHIGPGAVSLAGQAYNYLMPKRKRTYAPTPMQRRVRAKSYRRRRYTGRRTGYGRSGGGGFRKGYKNYTKKGLIMRRRNPRVSNFINPYSRLLRRAFVKHFYSEWHKLLTLGNTTSVVWRSYVGNDLNAPVVGSTVNVDGVSFLQGKFTDYTVTGSQIKVRFFNHSDTVTKCILVASISQTPPAITSWTELMKLQNAKSAETWHYYSGKSVKQLKMYRTTQNMRDVDKYDTDIQAGYDTGGLASPTDKWYWHVGLMTSELNNNPSEALIKTRVTYYTRLSIT